MSKPKVIVLCGSSKFTAIMAVCSWLLERDELAITMGLHLMPQWYFATPIPDHLAEHEGVAAAMDELHLRKIDLADEVFVVNVHHYIGDSTKSEIEYAKSLGKKTRWYTNDPVGGRVRLVILEARKREKVKNTFELRRIIALLGHLNHMALKPTEAWPDDVPGFGYGLLNAQAALLGPAEAIIFVDGEESEALKIVDKHDCHLLHKFLNEAFDGDLQSAFFEV